MTDWPARAREIFEAWLKGPYEYPMSDKLTAAYAALAAEAYQAGQQSMVSERVCPQGHAQNASWSACFLCQNYDAGHAAGVAEERARDREDDPCDHVKHAYFAKWDCETCVNERLAALRAGREANPWANTTPEQRRQIFGEEVDPRAERGE